MRITVFLSDLFLIILSFTMYECLVCSSTALETTIILTYVIYGPYLSTVIESDGPNMMCVCVCSFGSNISVQPYLLTRYVTKTNKNKTKINSNCIFGLRFCCSVTDKISTFLPRSRSSIERHII
jgi:hypothetical protein